MLFERTGRQNRKQINDKQDDKGKFGINLRTNADFCKKRNEKMFLEKKSNSQSKWNFLGIPWQVQWLGLSAVTAVAEFNLWSGN